MALHPNFPASPHAILDPAMRWFPADEGLRETSMDKLMPPLVPELRKRVKAWRDKNYAGAAETSRSLLNWWFNTPHLLPFVRGVTTLSPPLPRGGRKGVLPLGCYLSPEGHGVARAKRLDGPHQQTTPVVEGPEGER